MKPTVISTISPAAVHDTLRKHLLVDGFEIVLDLRRSKGSYLVDAKDGKRFLDFFTFFASNPLGMNHPKLAEDDAFLQRLTAAAVNKPSNSDIFTVELAEMVDTFARVAIPSYLPHAFFVSGGALAVENALKTAFDWKVQKNFAKGYRSERGRLILHLEQAFHGRSGYTMSLTNTEPAKIAYYPKFDWPRIVNPKMRFPLSDEHVAQTVRTEELAIAQAERHFEAHRDDIAAIIVEPIQGEGGDNHFRPEFHQALRDLADRHEALLIHDEVQTGMGLTGRLWCHEYFVRPDLLCFGKKAQVCGILAGKRVDEVRTNVFSVPSRINSTWGGNLVDMVRFTRILEVIEQDELVKNADTVGVHLLAGVKALTDRYEELDNPRGRGLMCAFDFCDAELRKRVIAKAQELGLLMLPCGPRSIRFRPALTVSREEIDEGLDILDRAMKSCLG
ncbi:MAG: L-lysine 6-transaminase [Candidatus Schekmanbacteria bacterium]|nr:L-lysine 6-transaminase [Candidatus Schekmanbacteria bacterium]